MKGHKYFLIEPRKRIVKGQKTTRKTAQHSSPYFYVQNCAGTFPLYLHSVSRFIPQRSVRVTNFIISHVHVIWRQHFQWHRNFITFFPRIKKLFEENGNELIRISGFAIHLSRQFNWRFFFFRQKIKAIYSVFGNAKCTKFTLNCNVDLVFLFTTNCGLTNGTEYSPFPWIDVRSNNIWFWFWFSAANSINL